MLHIVIAGDVISGHAIYGPFATDELATEWAEGRFAQWITTELQAPLETT